jgi:hypothetical protein
MLKKASSHGNARLAFLLFIAGAFAGGLGEIGRSDPASYSVISPDNLTCK